MKLLVGVHLLHHVESTSSLEPANLAVVEGVVDSDIEGSTVAGLRKESS